MANCYKTEKIISDNALVIPYVEMELKLYFEHEGFEYRSEKNNGVINIFVKKGNLLQEYMGLHSALNIRLIPTYSGKVNFIAEIGFWEHQIKASIISLFAASFVLGSQLWGVIRQSHLDDKALEVAELAVKKYRDKNNNIEYTYCPECGKKIEVGTICNHK